VTADVGPLKGRLLVALPPLVDENFDRTVVLVLEHGDGGALGIVLVRRYREVDGADAVDDGRPVVTGVVLGAAGAGGDADDRLRLHGPAVEEHRRRALA